MLAYFNDPGQIACGRCDVCIQSHTSTVSDHEIGEALIRLLETQGALSVHELIPLLDIGDETGRMRTLRKYLDQGKVIAENGLYSLP